MVISGCLWIKNNKGRFTCRQRIFGFFKQKCAAIFTGKNRDVRQNSRYRLFLEGDGKEIIIKFEG